MGHLIPCKGSDEQLGREFDLGQAPRGSGRVEGSMQESGAGHCPCRQCCGGREGALGWLEELRLPAEQQGQSGLGAQGTKGWSHSWEAPQNSSGNGYRPSPAWAPAFSPSWRPED